jgi:hypothetical protein
MNAISQYVHHVKRVRVPMIESLLFSETERRFDIDNQAQRYLHTNGLIKWNEQGNVEFWVPLYKKRLQKYFYPHLNGESETIRENLNLDEYFDVEMNLNLDKVIRDYQVYAKRRGFRYFITYDEKGLEKGLKEGIYLVFFKNTITNPNIVESVECFDAVKISTYLVRYDVELDFSAPLKK